MSQYYANDNYNQEIKRDDMWLIDKDIRRCIRKSRQNYNENFNPNSNSDHNDIIVNMDTDVSITDSETSSEDTRPIVPEKINKPDISLKNKILKTINKSLFSTELTGIDLNMLKLNDNYKKILRKIEKRALERELDHDLIRSFSFNHLADLRKEDIRYSNMRLNSASLKNSYTTDDIQDLYMPKMLENYKLKIATQKNAKHSNLLSESFSFSSPKKRQSTSQSPIRNFYYQDEPIQLYHLKSNVENNDLITDRHQITSPPSIHLKSPPSLKSSIASPPFRTNPNNLFSQIIQEKLNEIDHKMAQEIASAPRKAYKKPANLLVRKQFKIDESEEENEESIRSSDGASTDRDVDESIEENSSSESDDLNMNEEELLNFDYANKSKANAKAAPKNACKKVSKSHTENKLNLHNPGALISEFYISNMNYAMRYSVEYIQQVAKDLRKRRQKLDSFTFAGSETCTNRKNQKLNRSLSVDKLYAVRKEHIRFANGAEAAHAPVASDAVNISFTTDDIQDIYMPSAIDNYKRKIAVELERRRRCATLYDYSNQHTEDHSPERANVLREELHELDMISQNLPPPGPPVVVLDDLDIFIIKRTKSSVERDDLHEQKVKSYQPTIFRDPGVTYQKRSSLRKVPSVYNEQEEEDTDECIQRASFKTDKSNVNYVIKNTIDICSRKADTSIGSKLCVMDYVDSASVSSSSITEPEKVVVTRERVPSFRNYALIHKVDTMHIDNEEIIPSSSSSSPEDSSFASLNETSNSDLLNNTNLNYFEAKIKRAKEVKPPALVDDQVLGVERLNQQIVPHPKLSTINISVAPLELNKANVKESDALSYGLIKHQDDNQTVPIIPEKAHLKFAPNIKLDKKQLLISHPPNIIDDPTVEDLTSFEMEEDSGPKSTDSSITSSNSAKSFIIKEPVSENLLPKTLADDKEITRAKMNVIKPLHLANDDYSVVHIYENDYPNIPSIAEKAQLAEIKKVINDDSFVLNTFDAVHEEFPNISLNMPKEIAPPPIQFQTDDSMITRILITDTANATNHPFPTNFGPAHVVVPVNVRKADEIELSEFGEELEIYPYSGIDFIKKEPIVSVVKDDLAKLDKSHETIFRELKGASVGETSLELADPFKTKNLELEKLREIKEPNKLEEPPEWMQNKVYNVAQVKINENEAYFAHPFNTEHVFIEEQVPNTSSIKGLKTIRLEPQTISAAVLNLGQEETLSENESTKEIAARRASNANESVVPNTPSYINLTPTTFKIVSLNAPSSNRVSFEEEQLNDINMNDTQVQLTPSLSSTPIELKPQIAKKPTFLNKGKSLEYKTDEEVSNNFEVTPIHSENLEIQDVVSNIQPNPSKISEIQYAVGDFSQDNFIFDQASVFDSNFEDMMQAKVIEPTNKLDSTEIEQPKQSGKIKKYALAGISQDNFVFDQANVFDPNIEEITQADTFIEPPNELIEQKHRLYSVSKQPLNLAALKYDQENLENVEERQKFQAELRDKTLKIRGKLDHASIVAFEVSTF